MRKTTTREMKHSIVTTGDVVLDRFIYTGDRMLPEEKGSVSPVLMDSLGGAYMLHQLIEECVTKEQSAFGVKVTVGELKRANLLAYSLWKPCPGGIKDEKEATGKKPDDVWRVEKSLGYDLWQGKAPIREKADVKTPCSVLVIDDAGLGFRDHLARDVWPIFGGKGSSLTPEWVILKMGRPLAEGDLWRALYARNAEAAAVRKKLVLVTSAAELRRAGAAFSSGFSWERTLGELCREMKQHARLRILLANTRHLVVNFGCEASVWFDNNPEAIDKGEPLVNHVRLVYDPSMAEDQWATQLADCDLKAEHAVYGHLNTVVAALAVHLHRNAATIEAQGFDAGLEHGLIAARQLRRIGHGSVKESPAFPFKHLAEIIGATRNGLPKDIKELLVPPKGFSCVSLDTKVTGRMPKTIRELLHDSNTEKQPADPVDSGMTAEVDDRHWTLAAIREADPVGSPLYGLAHRVALFGDAALAAIPNARFNKMLSVDREEIETLCSINKMMTDYAKGPADLKPLSIAAFGPPGAGKSFGIKQIVEKVFDGKSPMLEFNLSQLSEPEELIGAFHLVRDAVLKGATPTVFWDEFDANGYMWLQYLLAPMQDGSFQDNGHIHPIGKCIFVFAGATSWDFEHFGPAPMPDDADKAAMRALKERYDDEQGLQHADQAALADFRRKKGPDFMSRLDGHINVLGPNQRQLYSWHDGAWNKPDRSDITFPVRRAILLRVFLGAKKGELPIDRDLLRAFLQTPRYRYGARSLEKIALALAPTRKPFQRSMLPPPQALEQHLNTAEAFDAIYHANRDFLIEENLQKMAAAIDENYMRHLDATRTPLKEAEFIRDFSKKVESNDPWQQWLAATNMAAARRLPDILALVGLKLEKGQPTPKEQKNVSAYLAHHLDVLAKEEHDQWLAFHLANGWRQADKDCLAKLEQLKADDEKKNQAMQKKKGRSQTKPVDTYGEEIKRLKKEERIHTLLVPFESLSDREKSKDHDAITNYPETVSLVGWKIDFA